MKHTVEAYLAEILIPALAVESALTVCPVCMNIVCPESNVLIPVEFEEVRKRCTF